MHKTASIPGPHFLKRERELRFAQLLLRLDDPEVDLLELAGWIRQHEILEKAILQAANSPRHRLQRQISDVRHAIVLMGLNRLSKFAESAAGQREEAVLSDALAN